MRIFVTGGAGFIGSHALLTLLRARHEVTVYDNLSNGSREALSRVSQLANAPVPLHVGDMRDGATLDEAMAEARPDAVIHFAGLKAVGESEADPLLYYDQNVSGAVQLLRVMERVGCKRIVFSSSATVYGEPEYLPYDEAHPTRPANPYGRTKLMVEQIIADWCAADPARSGINLRYFNPVGADASARIGEDPDGIPNNLMPFIAQVAVGRRAELSVFGGDYDTRDGTGERDYIHVTDLARAHLAAIEVTGQRSGCLPVNVGTGRGVTVLEMIAAFERASGRKIPYRITPRRPGDIASFYASDARAREVLGWQAQFGIEEMCASTWEWQKANPQGYGDA